MMGLIKIGKSKEDLGWTRRDMSSVWSSKTSGTWCSSGSWYLILELRERDVP